MRLHRAVLRPYHHEPWGRPHPPPWRLPPNNAVFLPIHATPAAGARLAIVLTRGARGLAQAVLAQATEQVLALVAQCSPLSLAHRRAPCASTDLRASVELYNDELHSSKQQGDI